ncbi:MAG TPA: nitroreductase family protein [Candidatus Nanoarchaeia archaeon]
MGFQEIAKNRHSIRAYLPKEIEEEKLTQILEAARQAPSAGNLQAYKIFVVKESQTKQQIAAAANDQDFLGQAAVILIFCQDPYQSAKKYRKRGEELFSLQDATIACAYAQIAASDLGLGTCWVGAFDEEKVREIVHISQTLRPVALLPVGYPAETPPPHDRRPLSELVVKR